MSIKRVLWDEIVESYMEDGDNPRIDTYQVIKMCRVIMKCLKDIDGRIDDLEETLNYLKDKECKKDEPTNYSIKGLSKDHPAQKDFNKFMQNKAKTNIEDEIKQELHKDYENQDN